MPIILGTAGHIDHGKTTLIKALTGISCDRLEEEKRRGITIELGFAYYDIPNIGRIGIVDVPGHEKFIKTMVAGASGIDLVMLVIAADEGIMPQTKEHIDICTLIGIKHGFVVLTKCDLVDEEWLQTVKDDVSEFLTKSFFKNAPIFSVSSKTNVGIQQIQKYIQQQAQKFPAEEKTSIFRLPIDRVFSLKGHGTVVTGTVTSGTLSVGDPITIYPSGKKGKTKTIHCHGESVHTIYPKQRAAINIQGLALSDSMRGEVVSTPETLYPSKQWLIRLQCLPSAPKAIKNRSEVHFHHATKELCARLYFFGKEHLLPGETALCQVLFREAIPGIFMDHCVIRACSPLQTIAGGIILNPLWPRIQSAYMSNDEQNTLMLLPTMDKEHLIKTQIDSSKTTGVSFAMLSLLTNMSTKILQTSLEQLTKNNLILCFDKKTQSYVSAHTADTLKKTCLNAVETFHKEHPLKNGISNNILSSNTQGWGKKIPSKLIQFTIESLLISNHLVVSGDYIRASSHSVALNADQQKLRDILLEKYTIAGCSPPNITKIKEELVADEQQFSAIMKHLLEANLLIRINEELYFSIQAIQNLEEKLLSWFAVNKELDLNMFKSLSGGLSRKYTIPLLEYFDKKCITIRIGDKRHLRKQ